MTIGLLLANAADRNGRTKAELARITKIDQGRIGRIFSGEVENPEWQTVEKLVTAIGTTWGDLFDEKRLPLSEDDAVVAAEFREVLNRLLANVAAESELTGRKGEQQKTRKPRQRKSFEEIRDPAELTEGVDEVEYLPHKRIPGRYVFSGAYRAYRVLTDAMVRARIGEKSIVFVKRPTQDLDAADGKIAIVDVKGTLLLKRIERRGKETWLISEHPTYNKIHLAYRRDIKSLAIVVNAG
ncbi:MAG TPA: S24 family peptidase [Thermoanaerobaculia bacterium]|nr:S24 family peptidase [Thermoanaerobaculia bacterium]